MSCGFDCHVAPSLDSQACAALETMQLPPTLPAAIGNAKADDEAAALLGFSLFFDARLSAGQDIRCANCHLPERAFADGRQTSQGIEVVDRNSPSIFTAAWHRWQMWDGKADSLWSQPLLALENPKEMNFTRLELAHRIATSYSQQYEAVFGPLPKQLSSWPAKGKPGEPTFDQLSTTEKLEVNRIAANVGKALEAYMRRDAHQRGRFDDALAQTVQLSPAEQRGQLVFFKAHCDGCHTGPTFSDDSFHVLGVPPNEGKTSERARAAALDLLSTSVFAANGPFHDGPKMVATPAPVPADEGAYRTPSLRNCSRTGPWGHNGHFDTLEAVVDFHLAGGAGTVVDARLKPTPLTSGERDDLVTFLRALDVTDPPPPWNNWPDR